MQIGGTLYTHTHYLLPLDYKDDVGDQHKLLFYKYTIHLRPYNTGFARENVYSTKLVAQPANTGLWQSAQTHLPARDDSILKPYTYYNCTSKNIYTSKNLNISDRIAFCKRKLNKERQKLNSKTFILCMLGNLQLVTLIYTIGRCSC